MRAIFNPWVVIGSFGLALIFLLVTFLLLSWIRPGPAPGDTTQAIVHIIPAPTETRSIPTVTPLAEPTQVEAQEEISIGGTVIVTGTGGDGLRLRFSPGLKSDIRLLGNEGETFEILDGPQEMDGYTWWYLENPQDRTRRGWGVADFLELFQTP